MCATHVFLPDVLLAIEGKEKSPYALGLVGSLMGWKLWCITIYAGPQVIVFKEI